MASNAQLLKAIEAAKADGNADAEAELRQMYKAQNPVYSGPAPRDLTAYDKAAGGGLSFLQGGAFNFGDELMGAVTAGAQKLRGDPRPMFVPDAGSQGPTLYQEGRNTTRALDDQFSAENPKTAFGLNVAGGVLGPGKYIAGGNTYGQIAQRGAGAGALAGLGAGEGDAGSQAWTTGMGALFGGLLAPTAAWGTRQFTNFGQWLGDSMQSAGVNMAGQPIEATVTNNGPTLVGQMGQAYQSATAGNAATALGERGRLAARANELGMPLTYGDRTGDATARRVEAALKSNPLTSKPFDTMRETRIDAVTGRTASGLGLGDNVTEIPSATLGQAVDDIGQRFQQVGQSIGEMQIPETIASRIQNIKKTEPFLELAVDLGDSTSPALIGGQDVMGIRSALGKASAQAWKSGDSIKGQYIDDTIDGLDGLIDGQIGDAGRSMWNTAKRQWRLLKAVERGQSLNEVTGKVNPGSFRNSLRQVYKDQYLRGGASDPSLVDLFDSVRVANLANDIVGDSGTATRLGFMGMLKNPVETTLTLAARPMVNAYARNGGPVLASALTPPGEAGALGARMSGGALAPTTRPAPKKRRRQ